MARPGIEPRTSDLQVRCPTDCATWPGFMILSFIVVCVCVGGGGGGGGWSKADTVSQLCNSIY